MPNGCRAAAGGVILVRSMLPGDLPLKPLHSVIGTRLIAVASIASAADGRVELKKPCRPTETNPACRSIVTVDAYFSGLSNA